MVGIDFRVYLREKNATEVAMDRKIGQTALWSKLHGTKASWDSCAKQAEQIELDWSYETPTLIAAMPALKGWRAPLWAIESNQLWLLRPEGVWRAKLPPLDKTFMLRECSEDGYRGAIFVDPAKKGKVWRFETGAPVDLDLLDEQVSPPHIQSFANYIGALQKCGQDADGVCCIALDDHFEKGPLSLKRHGPWLLASNNQMTVAYGLGESSRMWQLFEEKPCRVVLGSESFASWVPHTVLGPVMVDLSHSQ